jgi:uncharacterized DUF497 family protein
MRYRWDEKKNRRNLNRHGIAFEDARRILTDQPLNESMIVSTMAKLESMPLAW